MSGSTRAFLLPAEWVEWLAAFCREQRVMVFERVSGTWSEISTLEEIPRRTRRAQCLLVRDLEARHSWQATGGSYPKNCVFVSPPQERDGALLMTTIASPKLGSDELLRTSRRSMRKRTPVRTWYRGVHGGEARLARGVWCTHGAVKWFGSGGELRQEGVQNVLFEPEEQLAHRDVPLRKS